MKRIAFKVIEVILFPITLLTAVWMKLITSAGLKNTILAEKIFTAVGVLPVNDHYYQPLVNPKKHLKKPLSADRNLPGIDLNEGMQLQILSSFCYNEELLCLPLEKAKDEAIRFNYNNNSFESGDAEYLYNMIRLYKPKRLIEIGAGSSTLIAIEAFEKNRQENPQYQYEHICIEPYEQPWLERTPAKIIRKKVEDLDLNMFKILGGNDILFIDSSHIIRPQGDVLFELLEILPILNSGVLVHIHDIFTPKDYLEEWIMKEHLMWNEQYALEAFLSCNNSYEIIGALNFLYHHHREAILSKCPVLANQPGREPGSFWIRRK